MSEKRSFFTLSITECRKVATFLPKRAFIFTTILVVAIRFVAGYNNEKVYRFCTIDSVDYIDREGSGNKSTGAKPSYIHEI